METEKIVRVPGRVALERARDPREKTYIATHCEVISEFSLPNDQHRFEFQGDEFFTLKDAAKALLVELDSNIVALSKRNIDKNDLTARTREEVRKMANEVVKEIEKSFLDRLRDIFLEEGPFKKLSLHPSSYMKEKQERLAFDDLKARLIKAAGDELHLLLLIKTRPEILSEAVDSLPEILTVAEESVPDWKTISQVQREKDAQIRQTRQFYENQREEVLQLMKNDPGIISKIKSVFNG